MTPLMAKQMIRRVDALHLRRNEVMHREARVSGLHCNVYKHRLQID